MAIDVVWRSEREKNYNYKVCKIVDKMTQDKSKVLAVEKREKRKEN